MYKLTLALLLSVATLSTAQAVVIRDDDELIEETAATGEDTQKDEKALTLEQ